MRWLFIVVLVCSGWMSASPQQRYYNRFGNLDLDRTYADPTIISIGHFTTIQGQYPKTELRIEHRRTIYTCSVINEAGYRREDWRVGEKVQVKINGHFLLLRHTQKHRWIKFNLIGTDKVASL